MARRPLPVLLLAAAGMLAVSWLLPGCRQQEDLMQRLDPASRERLSSVPAGEMVLLSLKGRHPLADLPPLGEGGRIVGRSGNSLLIEVPRATLVALGGVEGVTGAAIWGGGSAIAKLDPSLRSQVLQAMDDGASASPLNMIATFKGESRNVRERLEAAGALPRTVAGPVATLDASPDAVLNLLSLPDLVSLNRPRILSPLLKDQ